MREKESEGEREKSGLSLFVTVISRVGDCFNSHSGSLRGTLCNSSHHLRASFAELEYNVWKGEKIEGLRGSVREMSVCRHARACPDARMDLRFFIQVVHCAQRSLCLERKAVALLLTLFPCSDNTWKSSRECWTSQRAPNSLTNYWPTESVEVNAIELWSQREKHQVLRLA